MYFRNITQLLLTANQVEDSGTLSWFMAPVTIDEAQSSTLDWTCSWLKVLLGQVQILAALPAQWRGIHLFGPGRNFIYAHHECVLHLECYEVVHFLARVRGISVWNSSILDMP